MREKLTYEQIIKMMGMNNFLLGKEISIKDVKFRENVSNYGTTYYNYKVLGNDVYIGIYEFMDRIESYGCSCKKSNNEDPCEHISAVLYNKYCIEKKEYCKSDFSVSIVNSVLNDISEEVLLKLELIVSFEGRGIFIKLRTGVDRLYAVGAKLNSMYDNYNRVGYEITFGKEFVFVAGVHRFNALDLRIFNWLHGIDIYNYSSNSVNVSSSELLTLLDLIGDKEFGVELNGKKIDKNVNWEIGNPFEVYLAKNEDLFSFKFEMLEHKFHTLDFKLVYTDKLYVVPTILANLYSKLAKNGINELNVDYDTATKLSKSIYEDIKDKYIIEEMIASDFVLIDPEVKIYLDMKKDIICRLVFKYKDNEIDYFSESSNFRNDIFENKVVNDLMSYGFYKGDTNFGISKLDNIVDFFENWLAVLSEKYTVLTTTNFSKTNIRSKSSVSSQFSIGTDNIMSYSFNVEGIKDGELDKIFATMKKKEKYYKLKSGDIIDVTDSNLIDLYNVMDDLGISELEGSIDKYRALYLDSIKDMEIINTDGLFDDFIRNFNEFKNSEVILCKNDSMILRDYQQLGVKWLYNIYKCGFGGILADEMGLGKTIQTIMFIKNVILEKPDCKILIVAPTSLIYNWEREFNKFASELKYVVVASDKSSRVKTINTNNNVFITTYGLLRRDAEHYEGIDFEVVIIDEAQNIKNPKAGISKACSLISSNVKIALTGTPVENSVMEVWSIFNFIMPGYLNNLSHFQSKFNVKEMDEESHNVLKLLHELIRPFILRRKKADVLLDLPDKLENNIYLDLSNEQKKCYSLALKESQEEYERLLEVDGFLKARFAVLKLLTRLRQVCISPSLIYDNYEYDAVKIIEIVNLLTNYISNGHKVLLFTSFKSALNIVKEKLDENGITNYVIDGSVSSKKRDMLVDAFNKDNTNVFLITLKAGGTGLNLTSASVVIHLDMWWNPAAENQATDRAHRIGQKNSVEVVKLICKGTIEEKILELQNKKKILNDALIENDGDAYFSKLNENDIRDLLSFSE